MFTDNAHPKLSHYMVINCLQKYKYIKEKGMGLKWELIKNWIIRVYKENIQERAQSNDKPHYSNKNKNIVIDGATDMQHVHMVGVVPNTSNPPYQ